MNRRTILGLLGSLVAAASINPSCFLQLQYNSEYERQVARRLEKVGRDFEHLTLTGYDPTINSPIIDLLNANPPKITEPVFHSAKERI